MVIAVLIFTDCFSTSLPEYFVTPTNLLDADLRKAAAQFADSRLPVSF